MLYFLEEYNVAAYATLIHHLLGRTARAEGVIWDKAYM